MDNQVKPDLLIAGPFTGEMGWELMRWQGYVQHLSKQYARTVVIIPPGHWFLYRDFANDCIEYLPGIPTDSYSINDVDILFKEHQDWIAKIFAADDYHYVYPCQEICDADVPQDFIQYGCKGEKQEYNILIHARKTYKKDVGGSRDWPIWKWSALVESFRGQRIGCIGSMNGAEHIDGTVDLRGLPLDKLSDVLASSKVLVGPSSGPHHLASLCGCPSIVWTNKMRWMMGGGLSDTNRQRYERHWNPLKTIVKVIDEEGWQPSEKTVIHEVAAFIGVTPDQSINIPNIKARVGSKKKILIYTSFNRAMFEYLHKDKNDIHPSLKDDWIHYRFEIWKKYTLESILNQSHQDWEYVVLCHPYSREITDGYFREIQDDRIHLLYSPTQDERKFISEFGQKHDQVCMVRIDSDDMYHPEAMGEIIRTEAQNGWYCFYDGHIYNSLDLKMYGYKYNLSGPFYCQQHSGQDFSNLQIIQGPPHTEVHAKNPARMFSGAYMIIVHEKNTTTGARFCNDNNRYDDKKQIDIMYDWGIGV